MSGISKMRGSLADSPVLLGGEPFFIVGTGKPVPVRVPCDCSPRGGQPPHDKKTHPGTRSARACPSHAPKKTRLGARSARACPSHASQKPLHIKVLSDLVILSPADAIDIKVFQTFSPHSQAPILQILHILAILLQTAERARGTGPRATAGTQNSAPGPRGPECL